MVRQKLKSYKKHWFSWDPGLSFGLRKSSNGASKAQISLKTLVFVGPGLELEAQIL